ncbi:MAG: hypothetical protein EPN91_07520 [Salinibacterium sp.]|nr:MAG: hypothetical protein EPN91_07520 [Salinibacterium sp.]
MISISRADVYCSFGLARQHGEPLPRSGCTAKAARRIVVSVPPVGLPLRAPFTVRVETGVCLCDEHWALLGARPGAFLRLLSSKEERALIAKLFKRLDRPEAPDFTRAVPSGLLIATA